MGYASYSEIGGPNGLLANLLPFEGNSMRAYSTDTDKNARWVTWGRTAYDVRERLKELVDDIGFRYIVYSYGTPIAIVFNGYVWVSEETYSRTTTRQVNLCRAWLGRNVEGVR